MSRLPRLTGRQLIAALRKAGFHPIRVKGSHHFLRHPDGRCTVVPVHRGESIGPGLMSKIYEIARCRSANCETCCRGQRRLSSKAEKPGTRVCRVPLKPGQTAGIPGGLASEPSGRKRSAVLCAHV